MSKSDYIKAQQDFNKRYSNVIMRMPMTSLALDRHHRLRETLSREDFGTACELVKCQEKEIKTTLDQQHEVSAGRNRFCMEEID